MSTIRSAVLDSGMVVLLQPMAGVNSAAVSLFVPGGQTSEPTGRLGLAGVVSEMLMRGAGDLDSRSLADAFDRAGCTRHIDAGGRGMQLRGVCLSDQVGEALGLLADTVRRPTLTQETLDPARLLSLQALESLGDDPRERASIEARRRQFPSPYNRSSYGAKADLGAITIDDAVSWWSGRARPKGTIVGIAGDIDADAVLGRIESLYAGWAGDAPDIEPDAEAERGVGHVQDDSSQVQIIAMYDAPPEVDEHAAIREKLAASVLSGGMSGRLFTEVREKRGLCYAVSAGYRGDDRFGVLSSYVGTTPDKAQESLDVLTAELRKIRTPEGAVTEAEFERARTGMRANVVFHGESTAARAGALVSDWLKLGRTRTLDQITAAIDAVTLESLNEYLSSRPLGAATLQTLGPKALTPPPGFE